MLSKALNIILLLMVIGYAAYYFYKMPKFKAGNSAPDFASILQNGEKFNLHSLKGSYVLLDFWGSWCGPCRMESPELVKLYEEYGMAKEGESVQFHIVSVAVENDKSSWEKAIINDNLIWRNHIFEVGRFQSPIVKSYGVKEIPTKYLISPEGDIIATNPSFEKINEILSANIGK